MEPVWTRGTRERFFYGTLALSTASVVWLYWPFLEVVVFAGVVVAVVTPLQERMVRALGGRRLTAALLTTLLLAVGIVVPVGYVLYLFSIEAVDFARLGIEWFHSGHADELAARYDAWIHGPLARSIRDLVAPGKKTEDALVGPLRDAALAGVRAGSAMLPSLVEGVGRGVLNAILFVFTTITLLSEGPRLRRFVVDLVPLEESVQLELLTVFQQFASRAVVGAFAVALAQGAVATVGYLLFGVPRALFFGVITGVSAFVPLIGTSVAAVPLVIYVGWTNGVLAGVGLAAWAMFVVGTVDNLIRPLILRGSSNIHPLLIFLAVFGGLRWLGLAGVLIGPVLVAFFLALATLHRKHGGRPPEEPPA